MKGASSIDWHLSMYDKEKFIFEAIFVAVLVDIGKCKISLPHITHESILQC